MLGYCFLSPLQSLCPGSSLAQLNVHCVIPCVPRNPVALSVNDRPQSQGWSVTSSALAQVRFWRHGSALFFSEEKHCLLGLESAVHILTDLPEKGLLQECLVSLLLCGPPLPGDVAVALEVGDILKQISFETTLGSLFLYACVPFTLMETSFFFFFETRFL